jgi:hypothetical protein
LGLLLWGESEATFGGSKILMSHLKGYIKSLAKQRKGGGEGEVTKQLIWRFPFFFGYQNENLSK